jgi:hypothetical protein
MAMVQKFGGYVGTYSEPLCVGFCSFVQYRISQRKLFNFLTLCPSVCPPPPPPLVPRTALTSFIMNAALKSPVNGNQETKLTEVYRGRRGSTVKTSEWFQVQYHITSVAVTWGGGGLFTVSNV